MELDAAWQRAQNFGISESLVDDSFVHSYLKSDWQVEKMANMKVSAAQKSVLAKMNTGKQLCSMLSIVGEEATEYGSCLGTESIAIATVKALLRRNLIIETDRRICGEGTWEGKPHKRYRLIYQALE